nr:uncharacterized protein LOC113829921 [Penaeus vannamei]
MRWLAQIAVFLCVAAQVSWSRGLDPEEHPTQTSSSNAPEPLSFEERLSLYRTRKRSFDPVLSPSAEDPPLLTPRPRGRWRKVRRRPDSNISSRIARWRSLREQRNGRFSTRYRGNRKVVAMAEGELLNSGQSRSTDKERLPNDSANSPKTTSIGMTQEISGDHKRRGESGTIHDQYSVVSQGTLVAPHIHKHHEVRPPKNDGGAIVENLEINYDEETEEAKGSSYISPSAIVSTEPQSDSVSKVIKSVSVSWSSDHDRKPDARITQKISWETEVPTNNGSDYADKSYGEHSRGTQPHTRLPDIFNHREGSIQQTNKYFSKQEPVMNSIVLPTVIPTRNNVLTKNEPREQESFSRDVPSIFIDPSKVIKKEGEQSRGPHYGIRAVVKSSWANGHSYMRGTPADLNLESTHNTMGRDITIGQATDLNNKANGIEYYYDLQNGFFNKYREARTSARSLMLGDGAESTSAHGGVYDDEQTMEVARSENQFSHEHDAVNQEMSAREPQKAASRDDPISYDGARNDNLGATGMSESHHHMPDFMIPPDVQEDLVNEKWQRSHGANNDTSLDDSGDQPTPDNISMDTFVPQVSPALTAQSDPLRTSLVPAILSSSLNLGTEDTILPNVDLTSSADHTPSTHLTVTARTTTSTHLLNPFTVTNAAEQTQSSDALTDLVTSLHGTCYLKGMMTEVVLSRRYIFHVPTISVHHLDEYRTPFEVGPIHSSSFMFSLKSFRGLQNFMITADWFSISHNKLEKQLEDDLGEDHLAVLECDILHNADLQSRNREDETEQLPTTTLMIYSSMDDSTDLTSASASTPELASSLPATREKEVSSGFGQIISELLSVQDQQLQSSVLVIETTPSIDHHVSEVIQSQHIEVSSQTIISPLSMTQKLTNIDNREKFSDFQTEDPNDRNPSYVDQIYPKTSVGFDPYVDYMSNIELQRQTYTLSTQATESVLIPQVTLPYILQNQGEESENMSMLSKTVTEFTANLTAHSSGSTMFISSLAQDVVSSTTVSDNFPAETVTLEIFFNNVLKQIPAAKSALDLRNESAFLTVLAPNIPQTQSLLNSTVSDNTLTAPVSSSVAHVQSTYHANLTQELIHNTNNSFSITPMRTNQSLLHMITSQIVTHSSTKSTVSPVSTTTTEKTDTQVEVSSQTHLPVITIENSFSVTAAQGPSDTESENSNKKIHEKIKTVIINDTQNLLQDPARTLLDIVNETSVISENEADGSEYFARLTIDGEPQLLPINADAYAAIDRLTRSGHIKLRVTVIENMLGYCMKRSREFGNKDHIAVRIDSRL